MESDLQARARLHEGKTVGGMISPAEMNRATRHHRKRDAACAGYALSKARLSEARKLRVAGHAEPRTAGSPYRERRSRIPM